MLDSENQIDSSNEFDKQIISGEKAEEIAKDYLKNELTNKLQGSEKKIDFDKLISDLKVIGISPMHTILTLIKKFKFNLSYIYYTSRYPQLKKCKL